MIAVRLEATRRILAGWETKEPGPLGRVHGFVEIAVDNRAGIQSYGCLVGALTTELAKLEHSALGDTGSLFGLFRAWLREQFTLLCQVGPADELTMHMPAGRPRRRQEPLVEQSDRFNQRCEPHSLRRWPILR
ncbi:hypothetical protein ABGB12_17680 [Actinocorallia sp. B10E7]|uniref:hypothetical protein n=1 Tax=Actinocorallia sp. B10E7 TaxID=3153558 RepID=UPI00325F71B3